MRYLFALLMFVFSTATFGQTFPPEALGPGVSLELAKWRAAHYSDVRYKLNLTLEKMSPVLKGTMEIRVRVGARTLLSASPQSGDIPPIILDWRKIKGHENLSNILDVTINGRKAQPQPPSGFTLLDNPPLFVESNEHLIFSDGVVAGENVIKLDLTSPILTSGSAITRYVDKEDGSEYIYSLFVPSDASTAFPVFDQPDLKARFSLTTVFPEDWDVISNTLGNSVRGLGGTGISTKAIYNFNETKPISTYVFAFAAGDFTSFSESTEDAVIDEIVKEKRFKGEVDKQGGTFVTDDEIRLRRSTIYVRKSQAEKFKPHAAEVFRLNREAIKYFEEYFDYKFPFPKYDLVLIPEFPFGGMEHAGATFLRESSIIFPQEPTRNDHISRAVLIFHEASHQWFGDTVTMRWFDDLWLKEGFATFTAYKAMEKIMPEMMAWKVFYERVKQAAYQTDSTKGTTPIYQEIPNLSAAKSAYGNIVYNKAPSFLRQAEFYLGEDKFQTAVRAFLKKHEFGNAGWEDLVGEFEAESKLDLTEWAAFWVRRPGLAKIRFSQIDPKTPPRQIPGYLTRVPDWISEIRTEGFPEGAEMPLMKGMRYARGAYRSERLEMGWSFPDPWSKKLPNFRIAEYEHYFIFPNYRDYGYGIFLLDGKSRDYVLKNIQNEKDHFLRSMMWGALWDSVREGELDPKEYVELVVKVLSQSKNHPVTGSKNEPVPPLLRKEGSQIVDDESTVALLLNRVSTAMNYYIDDSRSAGLRPRVEDLLIEQMQSAETLGQRITYYRAFLNIASSANGREVLRAMLKAKIGEKANDEPKPFPPGLYSKEDVERILRFEDMLRKLPLKTKDKFDIVTRLLVLGDVDAPKLLAELEKTETSDDAKRYAYAARGGIGTAENKAKYWNDFVNNKEISESWIEAAFGPWNSIRHSELTLPYLDRALRELPNHKRSRKIFFVNGWLAAFIGGQRSEEALGIVNKFLADNPRLDNDLRLKILENADIIERAVKIRKKFGS